MLYCKACQNKVVRTEEYAGNQCAYCRNGFVSQLACGQCGHDVPRGASHCARCEGPGVEVPFMDAGVLPPGLPGLPPPGGLPPGFSSMPPGTMMIVVGGQLGPPPPPPPPPAAPGLDMTFVSPGTNLPARLRDLPPPIPEVYRSHRHGAMAEVTMNGRDAEILTNMRKVSALLEVLAGDMNNLQGHMSSTRDCIRECRMLAITLQEEVEVRLGPNGARMPIGNPVGGRRG